MRTYAIVLSLILFYALGRDRTAGPSRKEANREAKPLLIGEMYPDQENLNTIPEVGTIKRIFLLEQPGDIENAISWETAGADRPVFIALRPPVALELENRGIPYRTILSYGDTLGRWERTLDNFALLDEITAEIDIGIAEMLTVKTLRPALFSYYYLKILLDVVTTKILVIRTIVAEEKPDELIAYEHPPASPAGYFPFREDESVFSRVLGLGTWGVAVRIIPPTQTVPTQSTIPSKTPRPSFTGYLRQFIKNDNLISRTLFNWAFISKHFGIPEAIAVMLGQGMTGPSRPVIIYGGGYNWDYSLPALYRAGIRPVHHMFSGTPHVPDAHETDALSARILAICNRSERIRYAAIVSGIDTSSLLFGKIASIVSMSAISGEQEYLRCSEVFRKSGVQSLLISTQATHHDRAVIQAAKDNGIRIISWQHGGAGFCYHPFMYHAEFFMSEIHLVFGEGVANSYRKTAERLGLKSSPQFIPVGSGWLDQERKILSGHKTATPATCQLVYITEKFLFNHYYNSTTFDSTGICDHFWIVQREILTFAKDHPELPCVFKFHPVDFEGEPARSYTRIHAIENIRFIVQEQTVRDLIPAAGVIIIDFVSTSVLEAALSDKPVFIYTGMFRMDPEPVALLRKRAFLYNSFPALLEGVERLLEIGPTAFAKEQGVDYHNAEFIREFGTHLNDGNSAERAAGEILSAVFPDRL
jgi:hypothetical protein